MKKTIYCITILFLLLTCFGCLNTLAASDNDLAYTISNETVTITGFKTLATGEVIIPSEIDGYPVTSIGNSAFYGCDTITSVTIPNSVTIIENDAFNGCKNLINLKMSNNITTIGTRAFMGCGFIKIELPETLTSLGDSALRQCKNLVSVSILGDIPRLGWYLFEGNVSLSSVNLPDSITYVGWQAFKDCSSLKNVSLSDKITYIGWEAFSGCSKLESMEFPANLEEIDGEAFENCVSLKTITLKNKLKKIGYRAFYSCGNLTSINIPPSLTTIEYSVFDRCYGLKKVNITDITSWCNIQFETYDSNPLYYAENLYLNDDLLSNIAIPNNVQILNSFAFYNCKNIINVIIPNSVVGISANSFYGCNNIEGVYYLGTADEWAELTIASQNENITNAKIIYNAIKKTYKFETNCDVKLSDVTDYAIFTIPTVENAEKTLIGWYDNETLSGEPITFPYYGNATTLYAAWTDRTGKSFDDAFITKANQEYTVTTTESGQLVYFEFVPKFSKEYRFYTTGSKDTYGYLYNSNQSRLTSNDDDGDGSNFRISYSLTAGETYYIAAKLYSGTGTFTLVVEEPVDYRINEITIKDMSGNNLQTIPTGHFLATVSFTNVSSSADTVIILAQYTDAGAFKGLMYIQTEDVPTGSTIKLSIPVDNSKGDVAELKAFCWESFGSVKPMGNSASFPVE